MRRLPFLLMLCAAPLAAQNVRIKDVPLTDAQLNATQWFITDDSDNLTKKVSPVTMFGGWSGGVTLTGSPTAGEFLTLVANTTFDAPVLINPAGGGFSVGVAVPGTIWDLQDATAGASHFRLYNTNAIAQILAIDLKNFVQEWNIQNNASGDWLLSDVTAGTIPFRVEPGAANNTFHVDATGFIGLGTNAPDEQLHVSGSSAHTRMRLSTTAVNGEAQVEYVNDAQEWLVGLAASDGWEVRDITAGNVRSFSIEAGAGVDTLVVDSTSQVGIGTDSPTSHLEVSGSGTQRLVVRSTPETAGAQTNIDLLTGTGATSSSNVLGQIRALATQVTPSSLKAKLDFFVNIGDSVSTALTLSDSLRAGINEAAPAFRLEAKGTSGSGYFGLTNSTDGDVFKVDGNGNVIMGGGTGYANGLTIRPGGDAGTIPAGGFAQGIMIANTSSGSGNAEISLLSGGSTGFSTLFFGDDADADDGEILYDNANRRMSVFTAGILGLLIDSSQNVRIGPGGPFQQYGANVLGLINGSAPGTSLTDGVQLYSEDVSASAELKVRDEASNVTTLSPHNFHLMEPSPTCEFPWAFGSINEYLGVEVNVDMCRVVELLEKLTGEKLIHVRHFEGKKWDQEVPPPKWLAERLEKEIR